MIKKILILIMLSILHVSGWSEAVAQTGVKKERKAKWTEDYEDAVKESKEQQLPMLLLLTGSDWCGYCIDLEKKVFEDRDFKKFADENLVLMKADFPRGTQKKKIKEQNEKIKKDFPITGFPTAFLLSPDGTELGKVGYKENAEEYIAKITAVLERKRK